MRSVIRSLGVLAICLASLVPAGSAGAITFGHPDGNGHPNVGVMLADWQDDGVLRPFCSGSLIAPTVFLTASHCTEGLRELGIGPHQVWVSFDESYVPGSSPVIRGTYHSNPLYPGKGNDTFDIAVIVLDQASGRTPAVLPAAGLLSQTPLKGRTFTTVGYGTIREDKCCGPAGILPDDGVRRSVTQTFHSLGKVWLTLSMNPSKGDGGACFGDSGGPHFLGGEASNLQVSITITGDSVCRSTDTTYRLDTTSARNFLGQFVPLP